MYTKSPEQHIMATEDTIFIIFSLEKGIHLKMFVGKKKEEIIPNIFALNKIQKVLIFFYFSMKTYTGTSYKRTD